MVERSAIYDVMGAPDPQATAEPASSAINDLSSDRRGPARMHLAGQGSLQSNESGSDGQTISDRVAWRKAAHDIDQLKRPLVETGWQMTVNTLFGIGGTLFGLGGEDGNFECASVIADTLNSS